MTFDVQQAALKELAALLDRAKEDIDKSTQFLTKVEGFTGGGGILNSIGNGHREAYHALSDWLGKLSDPTLSGVAQGDQVRAGRQRPRELEHLLIDAMRTSTDPMTKEIGSGLTDGSLTWRTVGTSSAYSNYVQHSLDAMQTFDFGAVVDEMEQEKVEAARAARQQDEDEDEEPDELWQGFNRGRQ